MADVVIEAQPVADGIYMLTGRGGNIGVSVGEDATFIIDDQFAPLTERIVAAIAEISDRPVDYVLNTHWHYDHTGGNENLGKAGALIMAHDHVHERMQAGQTLGTGRVVEPAPKAALPVVTFSETLTLHANGQTILGTHIANAHTDGDTIVFFREANVMHTGDAFVNGSYPFVDRSSGGHIDGIIAAAAFVYEMSDANTRIIPGHGPIADRDEVKRFHDMLVAIRGRVAALIEEGKSLEEIQAAKPTADFDGQVNANGFVKPDGLVAAIFDSLSE